MISKIIYEKNRFYYIRLNNGRVKVEILLRELCRLHNMALPPDLDNLTLPLQLPAEFRLYSHQDNQHQMADDFDSDVEEIEDAVGESEQESEGDEDLPLELEEVRNTNKVRTIYFIIFDTNPNLITNNLLYAS